MINAVVLTESNNSRVVGKPYLGITFHLPVIRSRPWVKLQLSSLTTGHLWRLFSHLPRVNDELERVRILMLFHQFEVDKPFGVSHGSAVLEPASGRFKQRGGQFVFAVGGQALHGPNELFFRQAEVVNQEFCAVGPAEMVEALQVRLPIADVLVVWAVNDVFAQDKVWLI